MNLARLLDDHVADYGDHDEVFFEGRWYGSAETLEKAKHLGAGLQELGVRPGDRVVVLLPNCPEVGISYWGAWRIGAAITPVIFMLPPTEIHRILEQSEAKVAITSPDFLANLQAGAQGVETLEHVVLVGDEPQPDTLAWSDLMGSGEAEIVERDKDDLAGLLFTGGTTGASKGVMLSHNNLEWTARVQPRPVALSPTTSVCYLSRCPTASGCTSRSSGRSSKARAYFFVGSTPPSCST